LKLLIESKLDNVLALLT